jgi:NHL repeat.
MGAISRVVIWVMSAWIFLPFGVTAAMAAGGRADDECRKLAVREVRVPPPGNDDGYLAHPAVLKFYEGRLYVSDTADNSIKIYSADGAFLQSIGRRGSGPGEFTSPSGLDVFAGRIYAADRAANRIQVFDLSGRLIGTLPVSESPFRLLVLSEDNVLLVIPPSGLAPKEKMLAFTDFKGNRLGNLLEASYSGRTQYDFISNMMSAVPDGLGGFFVVYNAGRREILHYDGLGRPLPSVTIDERYPRVSIRAEMDGERRTIEAVCQVCAYSNGLLYIAVPEIQGGRDVGPGRRIIVLDGKGRMTGEIELPVRVVRIEPAGSRLYAVDVDYDLRIFEVGK